MKTTALCLLLLLFINTLFGKIRNGYETQIGDAKNSLRDLMMIKETNLTTVQRRRLKVAIESHMNYFLYYELTTQILDQLKIISPDLYDEMDNLRDRRGRVVDVFVKLIPREQSVTRLMGATFFEQAGIDEDAHHSEYGDHSISVKIWIVSNALQYLYHELGHVAYVAPNLATYVKFYNKYYTNSDINTDYIGHNRYDKGGTVSKTYEIRFRKDFGNYLKNGGSLPPSAVSLVYKIRKNGTHLAIMTASKPIAYQENYYSLFEPTYFSRYP